MSGSAGQEAAASPDRALRKLFLMLFLRGHSARGLRKSTAPKSIGARLGLALVTYTLMGFVALAFLRGTVFTLALYLHGITFFLCGMFIAGSAGETLFNKEEGDILLHRPITPQALLKAKLSVLLKVSLWIGGTFNFVGTFAGMAVPNGTWLFPLAHAISTILEALFCTGCVVLSYELCLRWFGRDRLENVMTTVQVLVAVTAVIGGQMVPRLIARSGGHIALAADTWWLGFLPPAWFASFDDALAGSGSIHAWTLAAVGVALTATVVWLAVGRMARHYETGLQLMGEAPAAKRAHHAGHGGLSALVHVPPLSWCLRHPVSRASFLLVTRYLVRDRDVKLRLYPGLAPMLMMPVIILMPTYRGNGTLGFGAAFAGTYLGLIPLFALNLLQYSQQWQASDIFRMAPMAGPAPLCAGTRLAVTLFLTVPAVLALALIIWLLGRDVTALSLMLPGFIALPLYTLYPHLGGKSVPLSVAGEEAKSASRGLRVFGVMIVSFGLAQLAVWASLAGWLWWLVLGETVLVACLYTLMRRAVAKAAWSPVD